MFNQTEVVVVVYVCVYSRLQRKEYFLIAVHDPKCFKFIVPSYLAYHKLVFRGLSSALILLKAPIYFSKLPLEEKGEGSCVCKIVTRGNMADSGDGSGRLGGGVHDLHGLCS